MNINQVLELNQKAIGQAEKYKKKRVIFNELLNDKGKHFNAIIGSRGSGKTVLLKQLAQTISNSVYVSLDSIEIDDLFQLINDLSERYEYSVFLLDEIHNYRDYEKDLKKIYDFLDVKIFFTSSVALSLYESAYDLSRRVKITHLYSFTYNEYLFFKKDIMPDKLQISDIIHKKWTHEHFRNAYLFEAYLTGGLLPFSLEEPDVNVILANILEKILISDIPLIAKISLDEVQILRKLVAFVGKSDIDGINYSSISNNLKITKYKAEQYIGLLEKAFVLKQVFPKGTNVLREPKVLMYLPFRLLYKDYSEAVGGLREDFFVEMMTVRNKIFYYLKTTRGGKTPDYFVEEEGRSWVIEIGGKGKGREQFKGIDNKKSLILSHSNDITNIKRPLFLIGYC